MLNFDVPSNPWNEFVQLVRRAIHILKSPTVFAMFGETLAEVQREGNPKALLDKAVGLIKCLCWDDLEQVRLSSELCVRFTHLIRTFIQLAFIVPEQVSTISVIEWFLDNNEGNSDLGVFREAIHDPHSFWRPALDTSFRVALADTAVTCLLFLQEIQKHGDKSLPAVKLALARAREPDRPGRVGTAVDSSVHAAALKLAKEFASRGIHWDKLDLDAFDSVEFWRPLSHLVDQIPDAAATSTLLASLGIEFAHADRETEFDHPLDRELSSLPSDLRKAFRCADYLRTASFEIFCLLTTSMFSNTADENIREAVSLCLELRSNIKECCESSILAVTNQITPDSWETEPSRPKGLPNTHQELLNMGKLVCEHVWNGSYLNQGFQPGQELNSLPLTAEVVKVGLPAIAVSLQRSLGDQDWQELWKRLLIEAATTANRRKAAPTSPKQEGSPSEAVNEEERLRFERLTLTITLDGIQHTLTDPKAFSVFKVIATNNGPITRAAISRVVAGTKGKKTVRRLLDSLPQAILRTIRTGPQGYCVILPARTPKKGST